MIWLYLCFNFIPAMILILKIKNKEYDDPKLFIYIVLWLIAVSVFWYYMDWYTFDAPRGVFDPDYLRK